MGFPGDSVVKSPSACAGATGDPGSIPGSWRRKWQPTPVFLPGESHRGAWRATVHGVAESDTTDQTCSKLYMPDLQIEQV